MSRKHAILPVGNVNTVTGRCVGSEPMFAQVWDCWEKGSGYDVLLCDGDKFLIVHSAGDVTEGEQTHPVGREMEFQHDQTQRTIGGSWRVLGVRPHDEVGLRTLGVTAGKRSIRMATYK